MTGGQAGYRKTLSHVAAEAFDETLTKGQADKRIDASQHKTGRGVDS